MLGLGGQTHDFGLKSWDENLDVPTEGSMAPLGNVASPLFFSIRALWSQGVATKVKQILLLVDQKIVG